MIRTTGLIRVLGLAAAVVLWTMATASAADPSKGGGSVPLPHPAEAFKGEKCVEPNDVMRRQHMNYLKHQRDDTLRQGIRGEKYSLKECVDCHAVKSPDVMDGKVRTIQPFCKECHSYAAVTIDCFACHTGAANDDGKKMGLDVPVTGSTLLSEMKAHLNKREVKQ
jgi:hypothetical protein